MPFCSNPPTFLGFLDSSEFFPVYPFPCLCVCAFLVPQFRAKRLRFRVLGLRFQMWSEGLSVSRELHPQAEPRSRSTLES